ncbi:hypothetical protein BDN72DRAFT_966137 [Pluteus cervinus]|uniref:Uncharacterized protein n=1 Tax=Pluteus cervinus TaxID=181527 RepID=A0ACD3A194_9AGAR|nr:hypothetical protein BDN72DRAFT_966137 [Pluteus cervinus]
MDAKDNATTYISHCTVNNTINHVTYASETKITSTTMASEETIEEIYSLKRLGEQATQRWITPPTISREVSLELFFQESCKMLWDDFSRRRPSVIWQESERIFQMQEHLEDLSSLAAIVAAPRGDKEMIPLLDWRILQEPIGSTEQMERYAKQDPLFVASLFTKPSPLGRDLDQMLERLSETVIKMHKLCSRPMVQITLNQDVWYTGWDFNPHHSAFRIDVSIVETGHIIRIPRYQLLRDPTRRRPPTVPPALTASPTSSNNKHLVPAPKRKLSPKFGPKPPPFPPLPNSKPGSGSGVSRVPQHKNALSRPVIPSSSSSKELTLSQRFDELRCAVKRQEVLLERVARRLG